MFKKLALIAGLMILLLMAVVSSTDASDVGLRQGPGRRERPSYSVAEPAALVLLSAGLVSLGIYATKKRGKKQ